MYDCGKKYFQKEVGCINLNFVLPPHFPRNGKKRNSFVKM